MTAPRARRPGRRLPRESAVASSHEELRASLADATNGLDIHRFDDAGLAPERETPVAQLRRRSFDPRDDCIGTMTLVDQDGVLRWEPSSAVSSYARSRRRRRGGGGGHGVVVEQLRFEHLASSAVGEFLRALDQRINPQLRPHVEKNLLGLGPGLGLAPAPVAPEGRVLVFVHGCFSHSANFKGELAATDAGRRMLARARERYDRVLFFDHPTLHVSPVMNAVDLERVLGESRAEIDLVCHSRGGLVARWWAEVLARDAARVGRIVLVGSPLAGTSLAAPPKLKRVLELLTNVFEVLRAGGELAATAAPLLVAVTGLLRVLASVTRAAARTPLVDAGIAVVPGLLGMSRTGDNPELLRLRATAPALERYHAVLSDFEPEGIGWRFWRFFTSKPGQRLLDYGADLVFEDANDLTVDTASMRDLAGNLGADIPDDRVQNFGTSRVVHHLNYFRQPETIAFLQRTLELEGD